MTFKIVISSAIVSALIAFLGNIITTRMSQEAAIEAAEKTAKHELDRMERIWHHESIVSSDEEFAEMASVVSKFVSFATGAWSSEALEKVAAIRSKECGRMGEIMDELYVSVQTDNYQQADAHLTLAIIEKRRIKTSGKGC